MELAHHSLMRRFLVLIVAVAGCATAEGGDIEITGPMRDAGKSDSSAILPDDDVGTDDSAAPPSETAPIEDTGSIKESGSIFETDPGCDAGLTSCGATCVDLSKNEKNCGMCGKACAATEVCNAGACEIVCVAPTTKCGTACVNTNTNEANCGMCGKACAAGETCVSGTCTPPVTKTDVAFPSTTSTVSGSMSGTLGAGGGGRFYVNGDAVSQTFTRAAPVTKLTLSFRMSDYTSNWCTVGTLTWNVLVNGTVVGNYSWLGGTTPWEFGVPGPDQSISKTYSFAAIAPVSGGFTLRLQATKTVCPSGGSWNWYPGGSASME
jgi:hypothetical protein